MIKKAFLCTIPYFLGCITCCVITNIFYGNASIVLAVIISIGFSIVFFLLHLLYQYLCKKKYENSN